MHVGIERGVTRSEMGYLRRGPRVQITGVHSAKLVLLDLAAVTNFVKCGSSMRCDGVTELERPQTIGLIPATWSSLTRG